MSAHATSIDPDETAKFAAMAEQWWDPSGPFKPLHRINPLRLEYIRTQALAHVVPAAHRAEQTTEAADSLTPLAGLRLLDIGCGGGLIAEPMARLGADVTAIDATERNVQVARAHAEMSGVQVEYRATTVEALRAARETYDIVLALEVVEHVAEPQQFLHDCAAVVRPGGMLVVSTLNRTLKSFALAIVGAEYVLRWLPRGTHDWRRFMKPSEVCLPLQQAGMTVQDMRGMVFHPLRGSWSLHPGDVDVNYLLCATPAPATLAQAATATEPRQ